MNSTPDSINTQLCGLSILNDIACEAPASARHALLSQVLPVSVPHWSATVCPLHMLSQTIQRFQTSAAVLLSVCALLRTLGTFVCDDDVPSTQAADDDGDYSSVPICSSNDDWVSSSGLELELLQRLCRGLDVFAQDADTLQVWHHCTPLHIVVSCASAS